MIVATIMEKEKRRLEFSQNWNGKLFTSNYTAVRLASPKYQPGRYYDVYLNGLFLHTVKCLSMRFIMISDITDELAFTDIGFNKADFCNILEQFYPDKDWKDQRLCVMLLTRMRKRLIDNDANDGYVNMCLHEKRELNLRIESSVYVQDFR